MLSSPCHGCASPQPCHRATCLRHRGILAIYSILFAVLMTAAQILLDDIVT